MFKLEKNSSRSFKQVFDIMKFELLNIFNFVLLYFKFKITHLVWNNLKLILKSQKLNNNIVEMLKNLKLN